MEETINSKELSEGGYELAKACGYKGQDICEVFLYALTDSNFHELRKKLVPIINKDLGLNFPLEG